MNITLSRVPATAYGIFGVFTETDSGHTVCVTLERDFDGKPKLPPGVYTCKRRLSPHFGYEVFEVQGVPDFQGKPVTFLEIHIANEETQLEGCIAVGDFATEQMIHESRIAFSRFMALQAGLNSFTLTVEG